MHYFQNYAPFFYLDFLFSIKHPTAERWHTHGVLLLERKWPSWETNQRLLVPILKSWTLPTRPLGIKKGEKINMHVICVSSFHSYFMLHFFMHQTIIYYFIMILKLSAAIYISSCYYLSLLFMSIFIFLWYWCPPNWKIGDILFYHLCVRPSQNEMAKLTFLCYFKNIYVAILIFGMKVNFSNTHHGSKVQGQSHSGHLKNKNVGRTVF